jgi:hypothetical protein
MITVAVNIDTKSFKETLERLGVLERHVLELGSNAVWAYLIDYHSKMDWKGPRWMPGPNSGEFAKRVVTSWQRPVITAHGAKVINTFGLLNWKVTGGVITAKRAKFLTIPLIPAAKAAGSAANFGQPLFLRGNALCRKIGLKVEAVYAAKKQVTQKPWPKAMPSQAQITEIFARAIEPVTKQL